MILILKLIEQNYKNYRTMNIINKNLSNKVVLITGSAGQLGFEIAKMFFSNDARVIMSDIDIAKCKVSERKISSRKNNRIVSLELDVTSEESVFEAARYVKKKYSRLDVLINNAAQAIFTDTGKRQKEEFMNILEVNTYGSFNCIQKFIPLLKKTTGTSSVVNIASIYGFVSSDPRIYGKKDRRNSEVYSISKAGIIQMTKYLSAHYADNNIRINSISPGGVQNNHDKTFIKKYSNRVPMKRMAKANEILGSISFLADDELSSYVTGQNILIDGGLTNW